MIGYRKKVVFENLRKSFPEKSESEIEKVANDFYHHLCDLIFETIKLLNISKRSRLELLYCLWERHDNLFCFIRPQKQVESHYRNL